MVKYALICESCELTFEGWFSNSDDYDKQLDRGLLSCPHCHSTAVKKSVMAPMIMTGRKIEESRKSNIKHLTQSYVSNVRKIHQYVRDKCENVGGDFAQTARDMHEGKIEEKPIYGETTSDEAQNLIEDGIPIAPLPPKLPDADDPNKLN